MTGDVGIKERIASCICGGLEARCSGEPVSVSLCHCLDCQRRTGSAFGIAAFYPAGQVVTCGEYSLYRRVSEQGDAFSFAFCPRCGGTVYWETVRKPGIVAVAAGAFADPQFPPPRKSVFEEHRHPWVDTDI